MIEMTPIVETHDLSKRFGDVIAVQSLSMSVEEGEILGLLGPNGAGKTTTTRILSGMIDPSDGYAEVAGFRTDMEAESLHEVIGLLTETPGFYERFSARENLLYFAGFYDIDAEKQVDKYLETMGLWDRREDRVGTYSRGMKKRLALARSMLSEPEVLFLDEPTSGLDPESARGVRELILKFKGEGRTIFLATHNLEEAEELCDRIAVFQNRLVAIDRPEDLRSHMFRRQVVVELESVTEAVASGIEELSFITSIERDGNRLIVEMDDFDKNRPALVRRTVEKGGNVISVFEKEHKLEDIYLRLVREEAGK